MNGELKYDPGDAIKVLIGSGIYENYFTEGEKRSILEIIDGVRTNIFDEYGVILPKVHIVDEAKLHPNEYVFYLYGREIGRFEQAPSQYLCMDTGSVTKKINEKIKFKETKDPAFGVPALIIDEKHKKLAQKSGYAVVDLLSIFQTFFTELMRKNLHKLIDIPMTEKMIADLGGRESPLMRHVFGELSYSTHEITCLLRALVEDGISIRNLTHILGSLPPKEDRDSLLSLYTKLRLRILEIIASTVSKNLKNGEKLNIISLSETDSEYILECFKNKPNSFPYNREFFEMPLELRGEYQKKINEKFAEQKEKDNLPLLFVPSEVREAVAGLFDFSLYLRDRIFEAELLGELSENYIFNNETISVIEGFEDKIIAHKLGWDKESSEKSDKSNSSNDSTKSESPEDASMRKKIEKSDLLITDGFETVMGLYYDRYQMECPEITIELRGEAVEKALDIANKLKKPIVEDEELARNLFDDCYEGCPIDEKYFPQIAGIYADKSKSGEIKLD